MNREDNAKNAAKEKLYRVRTDKRVCPKPLKERDKNVKLI
jgi:hypothetical protein